MKRLTTDTPKDNLETALNLFYIKDHETWVRGYGPAPEYADVSLFDLTRDIVKTHIPDAELPADNDNLSNMMPEWLMDGIDSAEGIVALLYTAAWAYAELRHKLMRYEDTGMAPEEIADFMKRWERTVEIAGLCKKGGIDHLLELKKAENEGKLIVLPCKTKETVYVVGEKRVMECYIVEVYIDNARGLEYMVSFDCDNACDGCPFNSWRQDYSGEYSCDGEYGDGCILGSDFGKTVFLTREEAEAELAGKGGTHEADPV